MLGPLVLASMGGKGVEGGAGVQQGSGGAGPQGRGVCRSNSDSGGVVLAIVWARGVVLATLWAGGAVLATLWARPPAL